MGEATSSASLECYVREGTVFYASLKGNVRGEAASSASLECNVRGEEAYYASLE